MSRRVELDHALDDLGDMLPIWLEKLRDPAQFWPQFDALSQVILDNTCQEDQAYVQRRVTGLLQRHHLERFDDPLARSR